MNIEGMIKTVQASIAAGGADVTQKVIIEVFGEWKDLRGLMQKPLKITLEASQMSFGDKSPMSEHAIDAQVSRNGRRKSKGKDLVRA